MSLFDTLTRYVRGLFWWELLPLAQRLTLTGFVLLVDGRYALLRLLLGLMVAAMCIAPRNTFSCPALATIPCTTHFSTPDYQSTTCLHLLHASPGTWWCYCSRGRTRTALST